MGQWVWPSVVGDLMDALIHGIDDDVCRLGAAMANPQGFARLCDGGHIQLHRQLALIWIGGEGLHGVAKRTHEDFGRIQCPHEGDIHIARAFQALWHRDVLHATRGAALKPLPRHHIFTFDGDQSSARVGRGDGEFQLISAVPGWLCQLHIQLGVAL